MNARYHAEVARRVVRGHIWGAIEGRRLRRELTDVRRFVAFVGYSRSGHSVVAATLDAHRNTAVAHEEGAVLLAGARVPRRALLGAMAANTRKVGHTRGHTGARSGGYAYDIPGQWQGRWERLEVVGDKHGEDNAMRLIASPELGGRLQRCLGVPVTWIHVVRNPFDNVATMIRRAGATSPDERRAVTQRYVNLSSALERLLDQLVPDSVVTVRHETFVAAPADELSRVCRALDLDAPSDYLAACAALVFPDPRRTRHELEAEPELRELLDERIAESGVLAGYAYEEPVERSTR